MKKNFFALITLLVCLLSCQEDLDEYEKTVSQSDILLSTLINTGWMHYSDLVNKSNDDLRNNVIHNLSLKTNESVSYLQSQSNYELSGWTALYHFIKTASIRNEQQLLNMTMGELKNTLIVENEKPENANISIENQAILSVHKLIQLGYSWYLPNKYNNLIKYDYGLLSKINKDTSTYKFRLKSKVNNHTYHDMHVVKIVATGENNRYKYLSLYHISSDTDNDDSTDDHNLQLAGSNDLFEWEHITEIEDNGHQGDIIKWGNGYLIAYEDDHDHGTNHVAIKYYDSYDHIINENASFERIMPHRINNKDNYLVEGTPDIRKVTGNSPYDGSILIGFHYYDGDVDRLAMGVFKNDNWKAWKDVISEYNLREMNFNNNKGSRKAFEYNGKLLTLQEARINEDWSTWRILLGLNGYYTEMKIATPEGSKSFANPSIIPIENNQYAITLFIPTEASEQQDDGSYEDNMENGGGMIYLK